MGAWGTRPYDNDTAADWFAGATAGVVSEITDLLQEPISDKLYDEYQIGRAHV